MNLLHFQKQKWFNYLGYELRSQWLLYENNITLKSKSGLFLYNMN